ncbi:MAG TPA: VOC family protein [Acidimicrobiales bacterium]|jgi:methylmalonyl-CoA/ethylmalonyl-CoA epimerase|nr:VOC family protein [Acidimicrobiales bacterium]
MQLTFHHIGVACRDLDTEAETYALLGYSPESDDFVDQRQGIRGRFIVGPGPRLELLVALPGSAVLEPWLRKGVKYYHEAFLVPDLASGIEYLGAHGGKVVVEPVPAVAFEGRAIAFVMLRNMTLVELVQAPTA